MFLRLYFMISSIVYGIPVSLVAGIPFGLSDL